MIQFSARPGDGVGDGDERLIADSRMEQRALKAFRWGLIWQAEEKPHRFAPKNNTPLCEPF